MKYLIYRLSFSLLILSVPVADAITWTNTAGGDWNTPQNWSPNQVPGGNDTATISSSGFKVRISGTNSTLGLTLSANSSLTVLSNGVFNILGDTIIRGSFTNQGTVVWQAGVVDLYNSGTSPNLGVIWNSAGALWDTQCDQSFSALSPSLEQFHNFGVFRKSVTTGTTTVGIHFDNQGTVDGQTGMVNFPIGGNLSGTFSGQVGVKSATAVITGAFSGTFNLYTNGGFTNNSGWTVLTNGTLNILGPATILGILTNEGTVAWQAGALTMTHSPGAGEVWNMPGALWDIQCDQSINTGLPKFHNAGLLRKSASSNTTSLLINLSNSGTVEALAGSLVLTGTGDLGGTLLADAGAGLYFSFNSTLVYYYFNLNNPICLGPGRLGAQSNAALTGSFTGTLNLYGTAYLGNRFFPFVVPTNSVLNILSNAAVSGPFTNQGSVIWQKGGLEIENDGTPNYTGEIWNAAGAIWDVQCDLATAAPFKVNVNAERFHNLGWFRKSVTTGTTTFKYIFDNQGTVEAKSGLLEFTNTFTSTPTAAVLIDLGGLTPGVGFGRLQMDAAPALGGSFTVAAANGYSPNPGDSFNVLAYPSATGDFLCMNGLDAGGGRRLEPHFNPQGLTLTAVGYATNPAPQLSLFHANQGILVSWPSTLSGYQLYSTTNVANPNWQSVTIIGQNNAVLSTTLPQQYFTLQAQ